MKRIVLIFLLTAFVTVSFIGGCKKAEPPKPAETPAAAPTEPAPAPGEEQAK